MNAERAATVGRPPLRYRTSAQVFLRALGVINVLAFVSLWRQIHGLIGGQGILPVADYLARATRVLGDDRWARLPTLLWIDASDAALHALCALGVVSGLAIAVGRVQAIGLGVAWAAYLSLTVGGQVFLGYQWDGLLLETNLIALFVLPPRWRARPEPPSWVAWWLLRCLLFRLIFASGVVKLASGDATWHSLEALFVHYQTQPLPTWLGWWAHQLPAPVHKLSCGIMFLIELAVPFAVFAPPRLVTLRRLAATLIVLLQVLIAATGNYGFFNLLAVALALTLVDDQLLGWLARRREARAPDRRARAWRWAAVPLVLVALPVSGMQLVAAFGKPVAWPSPLVAVADAVRPWRSINGYGLFAVMTTERTEIVVEGSEDGNRWRAYGFRHKPSDPRKRPGVMAPHMPRLDWQMWFAALGNVRGNPWFAAFLTRLAEAEPSVLSLLSHDPFAGRPPRFLRARTEDWRFSDLAARRRDDRWWHRQATGVYVTEIPSAELIRRFGSER